MPRSGSGRRKSSGGRNYAQARRRLLARRARLDLTERHVGIDRDSTGAYIVPVEVAEPLEEKSSEPVIASLQSETGTFPTFTNTVGAEPCPPQEQEQ